jgi:hypothetical protein
MELYFCMIERAEECCRHLEDTVNDEPDIEALQLIPDNWRQLSDIKKILLPTNILSTSLGITLQFIWRRVCLKSSILYS